MNLANISNETILGKVIRLPLKMIPPSAPMRILQGPLRGKRWIAGSTIHGCWLGTFEPVKQKLFAAAIKPGSVVYDLGAHVGFYSLLAGIQAGPEGKIFCFEPLPRNIGYMRKHFEMNDIHNCFIWDVAVSNREGTASFDFQSSDPSMGHLSAGSFGPLCVKTVTLDALVATGELAPPDLIKCDIEGGEFDALTGASSILSKFAPTVFLATHGPEVHRKCCELLADLHYRLVSLDDLPLERTAEVLALRDTQ